MQHLQLQRRQRGTFVWGFNDVTGLNLPTCGTVTVFLNTTGYTGEQAPTAPYSLIVYPVQGLPSVYPLSLTGAGATAPWTVNFPAGTRLIFNVADSLGNSGGVPPEIYTVQSGQSTACLPSASTPAVTMKIDEPSALKTCAVLPIHIEGGQKPYTVTMAVANSTAPSNKTLGNSDDTFEWVNQSAPNSQFIVAVSDSKGQYAVASKMLTTSGSTDASCPGQSSRSYNSNGGSNNSTSTSGGSNGSGGNGSGSNDNGGGNNIRIPIPAIVGAAVGAMILLSLLLLVCCRRKNNRQKSNQQKSKDRGKGGIGIWDRKQYRNPNLDHSPGRNQNPFAHHNVGEPVHQNHVQPTPFVLPSQSNSALAYYGDDSTSSIQKTPSPNPTSSVQALTYYQQRPEDRPQSHGFGQQPGYAYPPPSPSGYSSSVYQGMATSTGQRMSYHPDILTPPPHVSPPWTSTTPRTSVYHDSGPHHPSYAAQNPALLQKGDGNAGPHHPSYAVQNPALLQKGDGNVIDSGPAAPVSAANWKAAEARRGTEDPPPGQPSRPVGGAPAAPPAVYQHEDAGDVIELPPAYREYSAASSSAPPPP